MVTCGIVHVPKSQEAENSDVKWNESDLLAVLRLFVNVCGIC